jgi:hypothetical protein
MLRRIRVIGVALAAWATLVSSAEVARAEYPAPAPYVGVFGGAAIPMRDWDLKANTSPAANRPEDVNGMLGVRLGIQVFKPLAIEGEFGYLPMKSTNGGSNKVYSYSVNAYYQLLSSDWTPYVGGGVGAYQSASGDLERRH